MSAKPLLLLDIDGVLNPTTSSPPPGYRTTEVAGYRFHMSDMHRDRLGRLLPSADIVWATTWEHAANESIGPALGLPNCPVVRFTGNRESDTWKLPYVERYAGERPLVWVEDNLFSDAHHWANERPSPTLLVQPSGAVGLTTQHFDEIDTFLTQL